MPKKGRVLPATEYADVIAFALRGELGQSHRAIKTVMRWTGASERATKNWLSGASGPNGAHLLRILRHSDGALEALLAASRRIELLDVFMAMRGGAAESAGTKAVIGTRPAVPDHVPNRDPENDPDLNSRQRWFVEAIADGKRVGARAIAIRFTVSEKTAKRDIAALKASRRIGFAGSRRRGRYVLSPQALRN